MQQLSFAGTDLHYVDTLTQESAGGLDLEAALLLISHTAPDIRLAAIQVLSAAVQELGSRKPTARDQERVDLAFQKLCGVLSTDTWAAVRLEALAGLSGLHHASLAMRRQALSKRATYSSISQQPAAVDASLLDSATGAFVHGTEDDAEQVRVATIAAMQSLGDKDKQFADEAAIILISSVTDELLEVRKAALRVLLQWAAAFQQQYMKAKQQKALEQQQLQQQAREQHRDAKMQHVEQQQQQQVAVTAAAVKDMADPGYQSEEVEDEQQVEEEEQQEEGEWRQQQQDGRNSMDLDAPGAVCSAAHVPDNKSRAAAAGAGATAATKSQRGGRKVSAKRRGDTPPWGPDALAAAVTAMHDKDPEVRQLALQLALLLPPNGIQAVMGLLQGLLDCCERFRGQHMEVALQVVKQVAEQRAVYVSLAAAKIMKLLATHSEAAVIAAASDSAALHGASRGAGCHSSDSPGKLLLHELLGRAAASRPQVTEVLLQQFTRLDRQQQEAHNSLLQCLQQRQRQWQQQQGLQQQSATPSR